MIRRCDDRDFELIWAIINDGAQAYKGIIPADRWTEPYMSARSCGVKSTRVLCSGATRRPGPWRP